ncbi:hypothetical protein V9L05_19000 [Bernardetia sp. Wsw4-3y2]|uniref:hypothetical protein n=1 Tax=Bernardetia sp. Wsw4-3y2 TaxID=3127471 RepID=UPI0030D4B251
MVNVEIEYDENNRLYSFKPKAVNQKIWRVFPDPKSDLIVLEIREKQEQKNISQLLILHNYKKEIVAMAEMEATQTLLTFFDETILLSEIDFQHEMPLAKGLKALNTDFETIWELEEVSYYGVIEEDNQNETKVAFSLQSNYYSVPLKPNLEIEIYTDKEQIEAIEEEYYNLKSKVKQYFYSTDEYLISHPNYKDISNFVFKKTNQNIQNSILYTENESYLICSYLVENEKQQNENYLLCTDKEGNLKTHFLISENIKKPQEIILMKSKILWIDGSRVFLKDINYSI